MNHVQAERLVRSGGLEKVTEQSRCTVNLRGGMILASEHPRARIMSKRACA